jgi:hypothetical protein
VPRHVDVHASNARHDVLVEFLRETG